MGVEDRLGSISFLNTASNLEASVSETEGDDLKPVSLQTGSNLRKTSTIASQ